MTFDDIEADGAAAHERRIRRCRSCNAKVIWFRAPNGNSVPVDEGTVESGDHAFDISRHQSHFTTCQKVIQRRRPQ